MMTLLMVFIMVLLILALLSVTAEVLMMVIYVFRQFWHVLQDLWESVR